MDFWFILLIGLANFIVVSLFSMTGGMGLIIRPLMIFLGVPPQITIGTARTSSIPGTILSQFILHKAKKIDWKLVFLLVIPNVAGGLIGIFIITSLSEGILNKLIGVALLLAGLFILFKKKYGIQKSKPLLGKNHLFFSSPFMLFIGLMLVIVGGVGPISRVFFISCYGKTQIEAAAIQKAINFWQTIITSIIFIVLSLVDWWLLLSLMISGVAGNYVGTKLVLKKGENYLRILLLFVVFVSAIKLLFF